MIPVRISDHVSLVSQIDPKTASATTLSGDAFDMSKYGSAMGIVQVGAFGASATVDVKLQCAASATATYADFTVAKAITRLTAVDANKQALLNVRSDQLNADKRWVKPILTVGGPATYVSLTVLAAVPRHGPGQDDDLASVDEVV